VIIPGDEEGERLTLEVAQPNAKVVQPNPENEFQYRLSALESKIDKLIDLIFRIIS